MRDRAMAAVAAGLAVVGLTFALYPYLDIAISALFHDPVTGLFVGRADPDWDRVRMLGFRVPYAAMGLFLLAWLLGLVWPHLSLKASGRAVAFLAITLALGPGLFVNVILKEHSHRPRPVHVQEFGGAERFWPWYRFDGTCRSNCSFVSGEASAAAWMIAPALLAPSPVRVAALVAAGTFAGAVGLLRLAYGGHFASDVLIAILLTVLLVLGLARVFGFRGLSQKMPPLRTRPPRR